MKTKYVIESVEPLDETAKNDIHKELLGRKCEILKVERGDNAWFAVEMGYDPGILHRVTTSIVDDVFTAVDKLSGVVDEYVITTKHTIYRLCREPESMQKECDIRFNQDYWWVL